MSLPIEYNLFPCFQTQVFHGHRFTMTFSLYSLFEASLLVINGIAVLNEERFLSKSKLPGDIHNVKKQVCSERGTGCFTV